MWLSGVWERKFLSAGHFFAQRAMFSEKNAVFVNLCATQFV